MIHASLQRVCSGATANVDIRAWAIKRRRQWLEAATYLWTKGLVLGRDGTMLYDGDSVYVVNHEVYGFDDPIQEIDYFHGLIMGEPIAQMAEDEVDVCASDMIGLDGMFVRCMVKMQLCFRKRRAERYGDTMRAVGIWLARAHASKRQMQQKRDGWWIWEKSWAYPGLKRIPSPF